MANLVIHACDKSDDVNNAVRSTLHQIGFRHPALVVSTELDFLLKNGSNVFLLLLLYCVLQNSRFLFYLLLFCLLLFNLLFLCYYITIYVFIIYHIFYSI